MNKKGGAVSNTPKFIVKFLVRNKSYMRFVTLTRLYQALVFASREASALTATPAPVAPEAANGLAAIP